MYTIKIYHFDPCKTGESFREKNISMPFYKFSLVLFSNSMSESKSLSGHGTFVLCTFKELIKPTIYSAKH